MTKKSFQDECDINKIMARFQKTGALDHYARHAPQYGDTTGVDYLDALNVVANANTMFEELPSSVRERFENDPAQFLDFVQDSKNSDEMVELGLKAKPFHSQPEAQQKPTAAQSPETTPQSPTTPETP